MNSMVIKIYVFLMRGLSLEMSHLCRGLANSFHFVEKQEFELENSKMAFAGQAKIESSEKNSMNKSF